MPAAKKAPNPASAAPTAAIDAYLAAQPEPQRSTLIAMRATLRSILPEATEAMKYSMPAFVVGTKAVAGYAGFAGHCGYFPMSGSVLAVAGDAIAGYRTTKGGLQFPIDAPLPEALVRHLVELRLAEIGRT